MATDGERAQGLESLAAIGKEPSNRLAVMVVFSSAEIDGAHASNHRLPGAYAPPENDRSGVSSPPAEQGVETLTDSYSAFPFDRLQVAAELQTRGDLTGAQSIYWEILLAQPKQFDALHLLGVTKCQQGHHAEGIWFIERALEQRVNEPLALFNLGMAKSELNRLDEAVRLFDRSLAAQPNNAQVWFNRANLLHKQDRLLDAIESYGRALELSPDMPGALANMGAALMDIGDPSSAFVRLGAARFASGAASPAVAFFRRAIESGADRTLCLINIGKALYAMGDRDGARRSFAEACDSAPDLAEPRWLMALSNLPNIAVSEDETNTSRAEFDSALDQLAAWYGEDTTGQRERALVRWPFYLAYQHRNNHALMCKFGRLRARLMNQWLAEKGLSFDTSQRGHGPMRVGIVSAELYSHSVWQAIVRGWLLNFDPARIELTIFHVGSKSDNETDLAREHSQGFHFGQRPLADWVQLLLESRLDIIIYPAIGMNEISENLASIRLAPIQMASWGHPETTGLPTIDYFISAEAFEPPEADLAYSEQLIRLPRLGVCYSPPQGIPVAPDLQALGLDGSRPIILCPGSPFKYTPEHDVVLAEIVRRAPGAQLVFFHPKNNSPMSIRLAERIRANFDAEGLDGQRHVRFIPFQRAQAFFGLILRADLCLDTIGFSGFNTAMQILGIGAPLVAYEGKFMRGRLASGPVRLLGLDELVATTPEAFISIAARLATDQAYREGVRAQILARIGALYEDRETVAVLQQRLEALVIAHRSGPRANQS